MTYQVFLPTVQQSWVLPPPAGNMKRGIDVSAYQVNVPWAELVEHGLTVAIIKGDQMTATWNHVALARDAGVGKIGLYFWHSPISSVRWQVDEFLMDVDECQPDFIALDIEQWWWSWPAWWDYIYGRAPKSSVPVIPPGQISDNARRVCEGLRACGLTVLVYCGTWFVNEYAPGLLDWIPDYPLWWAHYYDLGNVKYRITWQQFEQFPEGSLTLKAPVMPAGLTWFMWQFTSRWIYPGQVSPWDTNLACLTI